MKLKTLNANAMKLKFFYLRKRSLVIGSFLKENNRMYESKRRTKPDEDGTKCELNRNKTIFKKQKKNSCEIKNILFRRYLYLFSMWFRYFSNPFYFFIVSIPLYLWCFHLSFVWCEHNPTQKLKWIFAIMLFGLFFVSS